MLCVTIFIVTLSFVVLNVVRQRVSDYTFLNDYFLNWDRFVIDGCHDTQPKGTQSHDTRHCNKKDHAEHVKCLYCCVSQFLLLC